QEREWLQHDVLPLLSPDGLTFKGTNEIVVMDNFSTDNTPNICTQFGVNFYQQNWAGYGQQKNDAIAKSKYNYILSIDADEYLSPTLQQSIIQLKKQALQGHFTVNRLNIFYGYALKYGLTQPDKIVRLFNKQTTKWSLKEVHETLEFSDLGIYSFIRMESYVYKSRNKNENSKRRVSKISPLSSHNSFLTSLYRYKKCNE
ncbi:MAG: glycosyltransferase family 2 protein, partial [Cytophagia bacterium]